MTIQADRVHSTPLTSSPISDTHVDAPSRRRFLSQAAGGTVLALAIIPAASAAGAPVGLPEPVFGLIEAHKTAAAAHQAALDETNRLERIGDPEADSVAEAPCRADMAAFKNLIVTAPTTFVGLVAWASYLDEIRKAQAWMFEEAGADLVVTLVEALDNLAVQS